MAIKFFLNQSGLNQYLENISESDNTSAANTSNNLIVIANSEIFSNKSQQFSSINVNSYVSQVETENGGIDFILTNSITDVNKVYHFRDEVENFAALSSINPVVDDLYRLKDLGLYAVWTGEEWDQFGIIDNFNTNLVKEDVQAISTATLNKVLYNFKPIMVSNLEEFMEALASAQDTIAISLTSSFSLPSPISIPAKKVIIINLNNYKLTSANMAFDISNSKVTFNNGIIESQVNDTILVANNGTVTIDGTEIISPRNGIAVKNGATAIMNSGSITSQEAGILGLKNSTIVVNGGMITGIDNGPLMGNGSPAGSVNDGTNCNIIMNGGTLVAHIQTAGYIACGVYVPNSGSFTMNGGSILSDGCGICMRGGQVNLNGGEIIAQGAEGVYGKVGDSRIVVGPYAVVYDAQSNYPAMNSLELNIASGMQLQGTDGDINYVLESGVEANVNDNR